MTTKTEHFRPVDYFRPSSITEAIDYHISNGANARYIAGGTDLLLENDSNVKTLIDVNGLNLNFIIEESDKLIIGATTRLTELVEDKNVESELYQTIRDAAYSIGSIQIRNLATIGGNICFAVPSADLATALLALDAELVIMGKDTSRQIAVRDFFTGVRQCDLKAGEILTEIQIPKPTIQTKAAFLKEGRVDTVDLAKVNAAVCLTVDEAGICRNPKIALGAVAPIPMRAVEAEAMLSGQKPDQQLIEKVAEQASKEIEPISDVRASAGYRTLLTKVMVERLIRKLWRDLTTLKTTAIQRKTL